MLQKDCRYIVCIPDHVKWHPGLTTYPPHCHRGRMSVKLANIYHNKICNVELQVVCISIKNWVTGQLNHACDE